MKIEQKDKYKTINGVDNKFCTGCETWHPMNGEWFYKNKSSSDGFNPYCKEFTKKKSAKWQKENRERHNESMRNYFQSPKGRKVRKNDDSKDRLRNWQQNNSERLKIYRISRNMNKDHTVSKEEWENCKKYFNYECAYCGLSIENHEITYKGVRKLGDFHKDHFNHDGANDLSNCIPSCKSCNSSKGEYEFGYWFKMYDFYSNQRENKIMKWLDMDHKLYINVNKDKLSDEIK